MLNIRKLGLQSINNPYHAVGKISRGLELLNVRYHRRRGYPDGIDLMERDWNNCIILDSCRPDILDAETDFSVDRVISKGANSLEFIEGTFTDCKLTDTVYITANPFIHIIPNGTFHNVIDLWDSDWNSKYQTVLPKKVVENTKSAAKQYPNKRLIIHFMQPHTPFIGKTGRRLNTSEDFRGVRDGHDIGMDNQTVWHQLRYGTVDFSLKKAIESYRENVRIVSRKAKSICETLPGKTVITADHGELLGEREFPIPVRGYGHEYGLHVPELITVPWVEIEGKYRREIRADPPEKATETDNTEDRLRALGYIE